GVCPAGRGCRRTSLPGHRRAGGKSSHYRDHQPALLRVAAGLYQCPAVQGGARSAHRSGPHYRNRLRVVPFSEDLAEETQRVIPGGRCSILLPLRPTGYAPAERNSILLTFNVPRWARLNRQSGPNQLAKSTSEMPTQISRNLPLNNLSAVGTAVPSANMAMILPVRLELRARSPPP